MKSGSHTSNDFTLQIVNMSRYLSSISLACTSINCDRLSVCALYTLSYRFSIVTFSRGVIAVVIVAVVVVVTLVVVITAAAAAVSGTTRTSISIQHGRFT